MEEIFKMVNIHKSFGSVAVLKGASFSVLGGEIHALMGENGAGKSTLMNILTGILTKDAGDIIFSEGVTKANIAFVRQELNLAEHLSVAENIYMGRLPYKNKLLGIIDFKKLHSDTTEILNRLGAKFTSTDLVERLSTANKQLVEIAKSISLDAKVIVFDEPTTSLSDKDVENLFVIIRKLKSQGVAIVYISHRMKEIYDLCERITILRDGTYIGTEIIKDITSDEIIKMLVGRELTDLYPKEQVELGEVAIEVTHLTDRHNKVKGISFNARKGEIVGFAGLVGAGRTELVELLFGVKRAKSGEIKIDGKNVTIKSPVDAVNAGICLLTEDRKGLGLALELSISDNINMTSINTMRLNHKRMRDTSEKYIGSLKIKVSDAQLPVKSLSGGNQQKVVLAKWLNTASKVFIFDEPTKGIDVGAKSEIYAIMSSLAKDKNTILMVSSEIPELLGVCDRIYVICEGEITGELTKEEATQEKIIQFATAGGQSNEVKST